MEEYARLTAVMAEAMRRRLYWYKSHIDSVSYRDYIDAIGIVEDSEKSYTIKITLNGNILYWIYVEYDGISERNYESIANRLVMLFCGMKADLMDYNYYAEKEV